MRCREHVLVGAPRPEQARERHVDDDQRRGEKRDLAAEQAKARIDVAGEDLGKAVDDAGVHLSRPVVSSGRSGEFCVVGDR